LSRRLADFLAKEASVPLVLVDSNARAVRDAIAEGHRALQADAREASLADRPDFQGIGNLFALTDNEDLNARVCESWHTALGRDHVFRTGSAAASVGGSEATPSGRLVWPRVPKPSLVVAELERGEATISAARRDDLASTHVAIPLAAVEDGRVTLAPKTAIAKGPVLYLYRRSDHFLRSVRPELVGTVHAETLRGVLEEIVNWIVRVEPGLRREQLIEELLERERAFPSALGHGVAVPHAYSAGLKSRLCAFARLANPMSFSARADDEPIDLVFLLLSPAGDPEGHLAALADLARAVIKPEVRDGLRHASTAEEVLAALRSPDVIL
jgi:PTS system nitrogen regulatory IIA component